MRSRRPAQAGQNVIFNAAALESPSTHMIGVRATDPDGLSATDQATVNVIYNFSGFFQPVENPPTLIVVNAGRAVPLKFSLGGNQGLDIFSAGYPASAPVACGTTAELAIEPTGNAGSSSLSYDVSADQYT